jgi:MFS family permease
MTAQSKTALTEPEKNAAVSAVLRHFFLGVGMVCTAVQAEPQMFIRSFGGDVVAAGKSMALASSLSGLMEFMLNPLVGKASDAYGRQKFFLIGPAFNAIASLFVYMSPESLPILFMARVMGNSLNTVSGSVISSTLLSDVSSGAKLAQNFAELWSWAGLGVVVGPFLGGQILTRTGDPRNVYLLKFAMAVTQFVHAYSLLPETLPESNRLPFTTAGTNPVAFLKLFRADAPRTLRTLVTSAACISFIEGKNTTDIFQLWVREDVKASDATIVNVVTIYGAIMYCGGKYLVPWMIKHLGLRNFTRVANAMMACGLGLQVCTIHYTLYTMHTHYTHSLYTLTAGHLRHRVGSLGVDMRLLPGRDQRQRRGRD